MITFKEYLIEGNKKYYPYKLTRWKPGQKKRSIGVSNSSYVAHKKLKVQVAAAHKVKTVRKYKKKTKR